MKTSVTSVTPVNLHRSNIQERTIRYFLDSIYENNLRLGVESSPFMLGVQHIGTAVVVSVPNTESVRVEFSRTSTPYPKTGSVQYEVETLYTPSVFTDEKFVHSLAQDGYLLEFVAAVEIHLLWEVHCGRLLSEEAEGRGREIMGGWPSTDWCN